MKDEMDILREVASISAGHGSIALSEILRKKIILHLPSFDIIPLDRILEKINISEMAISVSSHILTGLNGEILFLLGEKSAFKLTDLCYKVESQEKKQGSLTELGLSIIKEIGGVVISSYLCALSIILKKLIIPSFPTFVSGTVYEIIHMFVNSYDSQENVILLQAEIEEPEQGIQGRFFLILNAEAMKHIQDACKQLLKSI